MARVNRRAGAALLGGALLGALSCEPAAPGYGEPPQLDHSRWAPISLTAGIVTEAEFLGLPRDIEVVGPHLVILDAATDSVVTVVRREDGRLVRAFGRRGEGPGEYSGAWSVDPEPGNDLAFWIYDLALLRLTRVDLERAMRGEPPASRMIRLESNARVVEPVWVDSMVIGVGLFASGRLGQFDANGKFLRMVGALPPGDADTPPEALQHAYQSTLRSNASRTRLALATRHADRIEIYAPDGTLVAAPPPLFGFLPRYEVREQDGEPSIATGEDLRFGYIDLATTDDRIYALFSGRTRRGFPGVANFAEYIHVFDWQGRLISVYHLDSDVLAIAIDPSGRTLYAIRHDPRPGIVKYSLPAADTPAPDGSL
ncbi:MAG TPA: BF3164 family lipoprotein [Longimicrobiales bacterium]